MSLISYIKILKKISYIKILKKMFNINNFIYYNKIIKLKKIFFFGF